LKIKLNPDKEHVEKVRKSIKENNGYCPCSFVKDNDHKCICKDALEKFECHCGLYICVED
jgi:ferredoxin-thioredoxin reductase catalytic subunit